MASVRAGIVYFWLFVVVFIEVGDVEAKRGGGRSSSRSAGTMSRSRTSFSSSRVARTYASVPLTGRVLGSSRYTSLNWYAAANLNIIYGGPRYYRMHGHSHGMPPICTNRYQMSPEGRVYGYFICPRENESSTFIYCCGPDNREYCCDMRMAQDYVSNRKKAGLSVGGIVGIVVAIAVVCVIVLICCKKRKQAGLIIRRFSRKDNIQQEDITSHTNGRQLPLSTADGRKQTDDNPTVPLNGPAPEYDGVTPVVPPPSYDAVTAPQSYYDGVSGSPYAPPQPPPYVDDKSGQPPPDIGEEAQPYWAPYPPAGNGMPYPNETSVASAPYPPPGELPYPISGAAPYPPPGELPYPISGAAPYPPSGDAPYPPSGDAPYPPPGGAPYPAPGGAPYPHPGGAPYPAYGYSNSDK